MGTNVKALRLFFCVAVIFLSCSNPPNRPPDPEPVEYCIYLAGKVVKKDGTPLQEPVLVKLGGLPWSDSTDSKGIYLIKLPKDSVLPAFSESLAAGTYSDTLAFVTDGQSFHKLRVADWIDTLPDVFVAEINVSGEFKAGAPATLRPEAVVAVRDSGNAPDDRTVELLYAPVSNRFTGVVYLVVEANGPIYTIVINVYGSDSLPTGRSGTITFSSQTAEIKVPVFNPLNGIPVCDAGSAQRIAVNDSFRLTGIARDSFSVVVRWEWDIGNTGNWVDVTPDSVWRGIAPDQPLADFPCILRVTNRNGVSALDTVHLQITAGLPLANASAQKTVVSISDTIPLLGTASDNNGSIVKWEWDAGNTGAFVETTPDSGSIALAPDSVRSAWPCVLRVTDDDGNTALDTVNISVIADLPVSTASAVKATVSVSDTVRLLGSGSDAFGRIVKWEWDAGNTGLFEETTPDSGSTALAPDSVLSAWPCVLRVTDDDGNVALDTVNMSVVADLPVPSASAVKATVSVKDTVRLLGGGSDVFGRIVKWEWDAGNTGSFDEATPSGAFVALAPDAIRSAWLCILRVTDDDGNIGLDTVYISVIADPPLPQASADRTTVSLNDTVRLRGGATDVYGRIVSWEWDAGNTGAFIATTPDSGTVVIAPDSVRSAWPCILRVTDDDGNIGLDTVYISVIADPPLPRASALKTTVSVNDPIELRGTATDAFGRIVSWDWDAGNTGAFLEVTPDSNFTAYAPDTVTSNFPCVLRVIDDDGNSATATVSITVVSSPAASASALFAAGRKLYR